MAIKIDELELEIKHKGADAADDIDRLAEALSRLKSSVSGGGQTTKILDGIAASAKNATEWLERMNSAAKSGGGRGGIGGIDIGSVNDQTDAVKKLTDAVSELSNAAGGAKSNDLSTVLPQVSEAGGNAGGGEDLGIPEEVPKRVESFSRSVARAGKNLRVFRRQLSRVTHTALGLGRAMLNMSSGFFPPTSTIGRMKEYGKRLSALGQRVARVASIKAIRKAITYVTKGIKEGIDALYQWSASVNGIFAASMDKIASSSAYLKAALGTTVSPLINAMAPAVEYLTDRFVDLLNAIQKLFAALTGQSFWTKATRGTVNYADALGSAASAAKEMNVQLMDFDEINNITTPNGGSGGGGANADNGLNTTYEELGLPDWAQLIKDAVDRGDWGGAGTALADKLNSVVAGINATSFGRKIADKINDGFEFADGFLTEFKFRTLGGKIADGLNALIDRGGIDWALVGKTFADKTNAIINTALGFLDVFHFDNAGTALGTALKNWIVALDWEGIGRMITGLPTKLATALYTAFDAVSPKDITDAVDRALKGLGNGADLGNAVGKAIKEFLTDTVPWSDVGRGINGVVSYLLDAITAAFDSVTVDDIGNAITGFFDGLDLKTLGKKLGGALASAVNKIPFGAIGDVLGDIADGIAAFLKEAVTKIDWGGVLDGIIDGIKNMSWEAKLVALAPILAPKFKTFLSTLFASTSAQDGIASGLSGGITGAIKSTSFMQSLSGLGPALVAAMGIGEAIGLAFEALVDILGDENVQNFINTYNRGQRSTGLESDGSAGYQGYGDLTQYFDGGADGKTWADTFGESVLGGLDTLQHKLHLLYPNIYPEPKKAGEDDAKEYSTGTLTGVQDKKTGIPNTRSNIEKLLEDDKAFGDTGTKNINALTSAMRSSAVSGQGSKDLSVAQKNVKKPFRSDQMKMTDTGTGRMGEMTKSMRTSAVSGQGSKDLAVAKNNVKKPFNKDNMKMSDAGVGRLGEFAEGAEKTSTNPKSAARVALANASDSIVGALNGGPWNSGGNASAHKYVTGLLKGIEKGLNQTYILTQTGDGKTIKTKVNASVQVPENFAAGGWPESGEYFLAREAGPELVGRVGNKTAVANNDQIVAAVAGGVRDAVSTEVSLLAEQNNLLRRIAEKNTNISLRPDAAAGRWVRQAQVAYARVTG